MSVSELTRTADTAMLTVFVVACLCCVLIVVGASLAACYSEMMTGADPTTRVVASVAATFIVVLLFAGADTLIRAIMDHGWVAVLPYR